MNNVIPFVPSAILSAKENVQAFIEHAYSKLNLWRDEPGFSWGQNCWKVDGFNLRFIRHESRGLHPSAVVTDADAFPYPFVDFGKAYARYVLSSFPKKHKKRIIIALRLLEKSLRDQDGHSDVWRAERRHFSAAEDLIVVEDYGDRVGVGGGLVELAKFLSQNNLIASNLEHWKHRFRGDYSGTEGKSKFKNGKSKLPSDDAILAIAEVFSNGYSIEQCDEDIFVTCVTTMMASTPMRISELLAAPLENFLMSAPDKNGVNQLYLPWVSPKNSMLSNKPVPRTIASITEEAYSRICKISEPARLLARHYETNPNVFYPHEQLPNVPSDRELSISEVVAALGMTHRKAAESFLHNLTKIYKLTGWTLNSLWAVVLKRHKELNPHFPYQVDPESTVAPVKMSESLMCFTHQQLSRDNQTSLLLLAPINRDYYQKRVSGTEPNMCFFLKHSFPGYDLRSHQLRHFLNTLYQQAGVDISLITKFSSRASQNQSRVYMHQSPEHYTAKIINSRKLLTDQTQSPIDDEHYATLPKGSVLVSQWGVCSHNYAFSPCDKFHDCLSCSELVMCKGHRQSLTAIKREREMVYQNWFAAKTEIRAGLNVATRWFQSHEAKLERLDLLIQKLEDPALADGSIVQMKGTDFSHSNRIIASKTLEADLKQLSLASPESVLRGEVLDCLKQFMDESDE